MQISELIGWVGKTVKTTDFRGSESKTNDRDPGYAVFPMKKKITTLPPHELLHESELLARKEIIEYKDGKSGWGITRRGFVASAGMMTGGLALGMPFGGASAKVNSNAGANVVPLKLTINSQAHSMSIDSRVTLLDFLREELGLTGTKKRLRSRTVWRLYRAGQRSSNQQLPLIGRCTRW
jgi:hypothetical protein